MRIYRYGKPIELTQEEILQITKEQELIDNVMEIQTWVKEMAQSGDIKIPIDAIPGSQIINIASELTNKGFCVSNIKEKDARDFITKTLNELQKDNTYDSIRLEHASTDTLELDQ